MRTAQIPSSEERIERILRAASDFEPDEGMPESISTRFLAHQVRGSSGARFRLVWLAPAALAAAVVGIALLLNHRVQTEPKSTVQIARIDEHANPGRPPNTKQTAAKDEIQTALERHPLPTTQIGAFGHNKGRNGSEPPRLPRNHTRRRQRPPWKSPKVKWQVARYERVQTGLVAAGWVAEPNPEDGTIRISPALVEIPVASAEMSVPSDSARKRNIKHANNEEIR